jgi:hypothetical protein
MSVVSLHAAALELASKGYHVHPLRPRAKVPATRAGFKDASCDPRQIEAWWAEMPAANIGIACGASGVAVLDIDTKAGCDPREILSRYDRAGAPVIGCGLAPERSTSYPQSLAGRRGVHCYFRGSMTSVGRLTSDGCEIKAVGGYVVAPPSVHPCGVEYVGELPPVAELPAVPAWLRGMIRTPSPAVRFPTGQAVSPSRALEGIARIVREAPAGNRNRALFWGCCRVAEHSDLDASALDALRDAAAEAGLPEAEIEATIGSAMRRSRVAA